ncbi:hypothetical protein OIO90_000927 [Microbotryomycetes sp. JL221]|nr:hypothetical protein OIO90_000927 [Microbotryomycetes sp. JL221]
MVSTANATQARVDASGHPTPPATSTSTVQHNTSANSLAAGSSIIRQRHVASPATVAGACRLLWRGRMIDESNNGRPLYGIAIVAQLFAVASLSALPSSSPRIASMQPSPFDDPFSTTSTSSGADMCLGLEMLRGADLKIKNQVKVTCSTIPDNARPSSSGSSSKSKTLNENIKTTSTCPVVDVETPTDVRLYVDPRCPDSVAWFQDMFCREGRQGLGFKLDVGGDEIVMFASLPSKIQDDVTQTLPELSLLLGRIKKPVVRAPRPDDPMPRENLFASKLRQSMSMPTIDIDKRSKPRTTTTVPGIKSKRQAKAFLTLMGDKPTKDSNSLRNNRSQSIDLAEPPSKRALQRSTSVYDFSSASITSKAKSIELSSSTFLKPLGESRASSRGPLKRSRSVMMMTGSPSSSPPPAITQRSLSFSRSTSRVPGSPTLSLSTNDILDQYDQDDDHLGGEQHDELGELRTTMVSNRNSKIVASGGNGTRLGLSRSASLPIGSFQRKITQDDNNKTNEESIEIRNKQTIRKVVFSQLTHRGIVRDDVQFKDVFAMTSKGVQFAFRQTIKTLVLDKIAATSIVDKHLDMYLIRNWEEDVTIKVEPSSTDVHDLTQTVGGGARLKSIVDDEEDRG